jgi:hypothetical protein
MSNAIGPKENRTQIASDRLAAIDCLLTEGIEIGPASKRRAINKVLRDFPEFTRGDCWQRIRHLRRAPQVANLHVRQGCGGSFSAKADPGRRPTRRPWTEADDDKLLNWAGYEPVDKIAQRLSRSVRAIRFRLCALSMSAKVTDGWSLRALRKLLRVSPARLRQFIGSGMLRVRDPRITTNSLAEFCERNRTSLDPAAVERIAVAMAKKRDAYPWERAADLLGVAVAQVQSWIAAGQLKVLDTFVTDRSFEEFCKKHGAEINAALIDPATAKWLIEEYGVPASSAEPRTVPRARKHALVVRTCKCGRKIAGNVYFRHAKSCKVVADQAMRQAVYGSSARSEALGGSI